MSDTPGDVLRAQWLRLQAEHAELRRRTEALSQSGDGEALHKHNKRLHAHIEQLHALMAEMEKHHATRGPIGGVAPPHKSG